LRKEHWGVWGGSWVKDRSKLEEAEKRSREKKSERPRTGGPPVLRKTLKVEIKGGGKKKRGGWGVGRSGQGGLGLLDLEAAWNHKRPRGRGVSPLPVIACSLSLNRPKSATYVAILMKKP